MFWFKKYKEGIIVVIAIFLLLGLGIIGLKMDWWSSYFPFVFIGLLLALVIYIFIYFIRVIFTWNKTSSEREITQKPKFSLSAFLGFFFSLLSLVILVSGYMYLKATQNSLTDLSSVGNYLNSVGAAVVLGVIICIAGFFMNIIGIFTSRKKWFSLVSLLISLICIALVVILFMWMVGIGFLGMLSG